jgi:hypothetical protein
MVTFPAGEWMSSEEAAAFLKVSVRRAQALAKKKIRSKLIGGRLYLEKESAAAWKKGPRKRGRPKKGGR